MNKLEIQLESAFIAKCLEIPSELQSCMPNALQHQVDVFNVAETHDIILDLAPTGTGKTEAGLSVLKHNPHRNAVYIAPTNALIEQQTQAAKEFVKKAGLPHIVKAASAKHIQTWSDQRVGTRSGEKLYNVLREPATIFPECSGNPTLLVTNPDIFYYATFFAYNKLDKTNIASEFYSSFSTIIFDEFHLYDAKQLVGLLFYLTLSQVFGYFQHNRKIVLLTATPEAACQAALKNLEISGVKIAYIEGKEQQNNLIPSQTQVNLEIRSQPEEKKEWISTITQLVIQFLKQYPDQNGAVILDSKDTLNRISDQLRAKGLEHQVGRIIGNTPTAHREIAAQKQVILATSTVDVGFNFKKIPNPPKQNLDWLIFSTRDQFSFWQRIGRVGRVLGKSQTDIPSTAIAYLPQKAWEEGIEELDTTRGRKALAEMLEKLDCMQRPFLKVYWQSEAFLEIAKPLLELEKVLEGLPQEHLVMDLYHNLQAILGGQKDWSYYRNRMKVIQGAINIAQLPIKKVQKDWQYIKCGRSFVNSFLKALYEEEWQALKSGETSIEEIEDLIKKEKSVAKELHEYAIIVQESYSPLFRFRDSIFENLKVYDPQYLLLDEVGETNLDPIHLLRFLEFVTDGETIELIGRAESPYNLTFSLTVEDLETFENTCLSKLYAFKNYTIQRTQGDSTRPTDFSLALQNAIQNTYIPSVIVKEHRKNRWAISKLKKQGLGCYPVEVSDYHTIKPQKYLLFPSLSGILAIAQAGFALKCPDDAEFWVA
ncbi:type I-D CRISPR-associated helicase Cas3' [Spirulina subsalsa FACHB-351]|uniref:Type I-D CRISPR-associated helicase Cas3 n=1 Tax=Spirulina subsalsa FACHB-351 TaxID=234711 RepID=A0ABT3L2E5_9CYAN|nr:type I-D CRISPR-associated helicase Cas3' [Spirulina subsalsa]MCW6035627.1 type I-D CRISPR-associated helicase Cas3' [Spirulina subsalsa FACHB-351]